MTDDRGALRIFLVSVFLLFLELACIRFFPARVVYLSFFTNTVLLASFVGMSVGCMLAGSKRNHIAWTPPLLAATMLLGCWIEADLAHLMQMLDFGDRTSSQIVFFGAEYTTPDLSHFVIPIELLCGGFFALIALVMVGPGQELGRALSRVPDRLRAYTANILGSIVGVLLFAACSFLRLPAWTWFALVALGLAALIGRRAMAWRGATVGVILVSLFAIALLAAPNLMPGSVESWSPYYRINFQPASNTILTNLLGHQQMVSRAPDSRRVHAAIAYGLPYMLRRDTGGRPFRNVLIIGAGSGNDVSAALAWGVEHVDAVEIDPVIRGIGAKLHPDRPYDDPRVSVYINDGRNFLRSTPRQYDLIVFALVDSLILHSSYSSIRLESYLFTQEAFADVHRHLAPGGVFAMYNYFRQGWIGIRLQRTLTSVFRASPIVLALPYQPSLQPGPSIGGFTMFLAGDTAAMQRAFADGSRYRLATGRVAGMESPNGFQVARIAEAGPQTELAPATVDPSYTAIIPTDEWPFLYLHDHSIPTISWRGMAVMAFAGLAVMLGFLGSSVRRGDLPLDARRMFFLGAGFMLIETRAVVQMALLFGGTWLVNTAVFCAVLVMILLANLFVLRVRPERLWPAYVGLFVSLAVNTLVPLNSFLGMPPAIEIAGASLLVFSPVMFSGIIFAVCFGRTRSADKALGANIAGSIFGGLAEYSSMILGFRYLALVTMALYLCTAGRLRPALRTGGDADAPESLRAQGAAI